MIESGKNIKTFLSGTDICLLSPTFMLCYYKVNLDRSTFHLPQWVSGTLEPGDQFSETWRKCSEKSRVV